MKKFRSIALLLVVFTVFVSGLSAQNFIRPKTNNNLEEKAVKVSQNMKAKLGLNDKQTEKIRVFYLNEIKVASTPKKNIVDVNTDMRKSADERNARLLSEMKKILTPEQYKKFISMRDEEIKRASTRLKNAKTK